MVSPTLCWLSGERSLPIGLLVYYVMSHWTIAQSIFLTIDWHYTMAWFPALLLKTHRHLSTCATTMHIPFVFKRRHATKVKMSHALATLNSNNFVVYGQKHKVWVLIFLELAEHFETQIEQIWWNFLFCNKQQLHLRNAAKYFIKRVG